MSLYAYWLSGLFCLVKYLHHFPDQYIDVMWKGKVWGVTIFLTYMYVSVIPLVLVRVLHFLYPQINRCIRQSGFIRGFIIWRLGRVLFWWGCMPLIIKTAVLLGLWNWPPSINHNLSICVLQKKCIKFASVINNIVMGTKLNISNSYLFSCTLL